MHGGTTPVRVGTMRNGGGDVRGDVGAASLRESTLCRKGGALRENEAMTEDRGKVSTYELECDHCGGVAVSSKGR